jgi:hypothetical protein
MPPPWITSTKSMDLYLASHTQHTSQHFSMPPPAQLQLSITPGAFAAACARACSLTAAGPSVIQAIAKSTQELLYIFIDDDPPDPLASCRMLTVWQTPSS